MPFCIASNLDIIIVLSLMVPEERIWGEEQICPVFSLYNKYVAVAGCDIMTNSKVKFPSPGGRGSGEGEF